MKKNIKFFIFVVLLIVPSLSQAKVLQVFSCQGQKVNMGDTTYSVFKKCGEPAYKEILSNEGCVKEEKWHYDCKGRGNVEELIFKKGILVDRIRGDKSPGTQTCN